MLQKIEASLLPLAGQPSISAEAMAWATNQVNLFFGSFRKADADDPDTFTAGCLRLFTAFPPDVVRFVVDPITGLPGRSEWLPGLNKVKAALDERAFELAQRHEVAERERKQIADRKRWQEQQKTKPTLEELKAKYGPTWGLQAAEEDEKAKANRRELLMKANRRVFLDECRAAGVAPTGISPSLMKIMRDKQAGS